MKKQKRNDKNMSLTYIFCGACSLVSLFALFCAAGFFYNDADKILGFGFLILGVFSLSVSSGLGCLIIDTHFPRQKGQKLFKQSYLNTLYFVLDFLATPIHFILKYMDKPVGFVDEKLKKKK